MPEGIFSIDMAQLSMRPSHLFFVRYKWDATWENVPADMCAYQRLKSACASCASCASLAFQNVPIEDSYQTVWIRRLMWILAITKTRLFKYIGNFTSKNWKISDKKHWYFHISAQNIDCEYSLELPRGSNEYPQSMFLSKNKKIMYTPVNPSFTV